MATRTRRSSSSPRKSASAAQITPPLQETATAASESAATALQTATDGMAAWSKAQLSLQIDTALAVLRSAQTLREAQLKASQQSQASHEQAARELESLDSFNDIARLQLLLARDNWQGAVSYWAQLGEFANGAAMQGWARTAEGLSKLTASLMSANLQWSQVRPLEAPVAEELEASVDHLVSPVIASPMLWPAQEAAREAMTFATSALNDWFAWSSRLGNGGSARESGTVH